MYPLIIYPLAPSGTGLAYMVNNKDYAAYLEETCGSTFDKTVGISIALSHFC